MKLAMVLLLGMLGCAKPGPKPAVMECYGPDDPTVARLLPIDGVIKVCVAPGTWPKGQWSEWMPWARESIGLDTKEGCESKHRHHGMVPAVQDRWNIDHCEYRFPLDDPLPK